LRNVHAILIPSFHSIFIYFIFLELPRSPWEVHAEPLGLRGAQVGNLCLRLFRSCSSDVQCLSDAFH